MQIKFDKAIQILDEALKGKKPKEIAHEVGVSEKAVSNVKGMFPLFMGLHRKYTKEDA